MTTVWERTSKYFANRVNEELVFWKSYLDGAPTVIDLPLDRPRSSVCEQLIPKRPSSPSFTMLPDEPLCAGVVDVDIPVQVVSRIKALCSKYKTTSFTIGLSVFFLMLHRYCSQLDILVGIPSSNRDLPDIQNLIGYFVNVLAIRSVIKDNDMTFTSYLDTVRESVVSCMGHPHVPFQTVVQQFGNAVARAPGLRPLVQVMFGLFDGGEEVELFGAKTTFTNRINDAREPKFDLEMEIMCMTGGCWNCQFVYDKHLFSEDTVRTFADTYLEMMKNCVENPEIPLSAVSVFSQEMYVKYLLQLQPEPQPVTKFLHEMFFEQARSRPDALAGNYADVCTS